MATRYTMKEALQILIDNNDEEAMDDIFRRYGGVARKMVRAIYASTDKSAISDLIDLMPDYITMQKLNKANRMISQTDDDNAVDDDEPKAKKPAAKKQKVEEPAEPEDVADDDSDEAVDYENMNARELFELCKERGIDTEPRKRATTYRKLLAEYDAKQAASDDDVTVDTDDDDDDDDWDI